ncbi:MAG TPA: rhodanese-like domain-containing protein [Gemmatimonadaceae bacterium]
MTSSRAVRALGIGAIALGALAIIAGSPRKPVAPLDVATLAREVSDEADHVTAVELARWIRDRKAGLRVIDIRDSADFDQFHIPSAERLSLEQLVSAPMGKGETIVLYSGGGAHAAQGWVFLRSRGLSNVYFLRGGVDEWLEEVMNPQLPRNAPAEERAERDSVAALSRYFGGLPRSVDSLVFTDRHRDGQAQTWRASVARTRGRGC